MAQTVTIVLNDDDIIDYQISREHWEPVEFLRTRGFTAGATTASNTPVFSKWPGSAPGFGNEDSTEDKLITDGVQDNYNRNGRRGARKNRVYVDSNGVWRKAPELTLTLFGAYDVIDPANAEWIQFDVGAVANLRGTAVSDFRWIVRSVSVSYEGGTARTTLTLDAETHGEQGVDDTPPPETSTGFDPGTWTPGDWTWPPNTGIVPTVPIGNGLIPGLKRLALIGANGHIYRTTNFDAASPSYDDVDLSGTVGTTVLQWCYDARSNNAGTHGWVVTPTAIYKINNIWGVPTATLQHTFSFTNNYRNIDFDYIHEPGLFGIVFSNHNGLTHITRTRDGGNTWTEIGDISNLVAVAILPGGVISTHQAGKAFTFGYSTGSISADSCLFITTDYGETWTRQLNVFDEDRLGGAVVIPYLDTTDTRIFFGWDSTIDPPNNPDDYVGIMRGTIPTGQQDITPSYSGTRYGVNQALGRFCMSMASHNRNRLLASCSDAAYTVFGLALTNDAEATTPTWTWPIAPSSGNNYRRALLIDPNGDELIVFGDSGAIGYSADLSTISSRTGNLGTPNIIGVTG